MLEFKSEKNDGDHLVQTPCFKDVEIETRNDTQLSKIIHLDIKSSIGTYSFDFEILRFSQLLFHHFLQKSACK